VYMTIDEPEPFRLDDEQRARVRDCLLKEGISLPRDRFERFIREIEKTIADHREAEPKGTDRAIDDALRKLYDLSHDDDPSPALLRAQIQTLPRGAADYIDGRVPIVFEELFPSETPPSRFQDWAVTAGPQSLIDATQLLSGEGAQWVKGRSRGGGKRSIPRVEASIRGRVPGAGGAHRGGRPGTEELQGLILQLHGDWLDATGTMPKPGGRGDQTGFGDLVHSVFQWLGIPEGSAAYALRQYWSERSNSGQ
jgi:hypothetical protein